MRITINSFVDVVESGTRPQLESILKDELFGTLLQQDIALIQDSMCALDPAAVNFQVEYMQIQAGLNWLKTLNQTRINLLKKDTDDGR